MKKEEFLKRTRAFGLRVIHLVESLPKKQTAQILGRQLLGRGYFRRRQLRAAVFISKMGTVEEECGEAIYWIGMLIDAGSTKAALVADLVDEGNQILSIVIASINTARPRGK